MTDPQIPDQDKTEEKPNSNPLSPQNNGILRCYNMYPRNYMDTMSASAFNAMQDDVGRIADMGFNAVWIQPIAEVGNVLKPRKEDVIKGKLLPGPDTTSPRTRSLYAKKIPFAINKEFCGDLSQEDAKIAISKFTEKVRDKGMVPMFDVAFSHISLDSPIVKNGQLEIPGKDDELPQKIDTTSWVQRYPDGDLKDQAVMHGVNSRRFVVDEEKLVWNDIALFNYDDKNVRKEIIEKLWKPFIDQYVELGFTGIRVDSVAQNLRDVLEPVLGYFKQRVHERWGIPENEVVILGETLGQNIEQYRKTNHLTHAYSSVYFENLVHAPHLHTDKEDCHTLWRHQHESGSNGVSYVNGELQSLVHHNKGENGQLTSKAGAKGGSAGYPGSHDEPGIASRCLADGYTLRPEDWKRDTSLLFLDLENKCIVNSLGVRETDANGKEIVLDTENIKKYVNLKQINEAMREQIAQTALIPDGGFFMFGGDEHLVLDKRSIFQDHIKGFELGDVTDLVKDVNQMLSAMPENKLGTWTTRRFLPDRDDVAIIERHTGPGFSGRTDIMIVNCEEPAKELSRQDIERLAGIVRLQDGHKLGVDDVVAAVACRGDDGIVNVDQDKRNIVHMDRSVRLSKELMQSMPQPVVKGSGAETSPAMVGRGRD